MAKTLNSLDEDMAAFAEYDLCNATREEVKEFFAAKAEYLKAPTMENSIEMKRTFQIAHSGLKTDCSCHRFSEHTLAVLTELLRKGV